MFDLENRPIVGVLLAGGEGTRLWPLTKTTNKHLLAVGSMINRVPHKHAAVSKRIGAVMLDWPVQFLLRNHIQTIHVVTGGEHMSAVSRYLGKGQRYPFVPEGVSVPDFHFTVQEEPGGIAQALGLIRGVVPEEAILVVILGDNLFGREMSDAVERFVQERGEGARVFGYRVENWRQFGVADVDSDGRVLRIVEKPAEFVSDIAVVGLYIYEARSVFGIIDELKPSARGELEISHVNQTYIDRGELDLKMVQGYWLDMGDSLDTYERTNRILWAMDQGMDFGEACHWADLAGGSSK